MMMMHQVMMADGGVDDDAADGGVDDDAASVDHADDACF